MAELRLQSGRVQAQGISSLPQPNMSFGQQQPQVQYQAAAENASTLSRVLSTLSTQMFGVAQSMAESAGEEFVATNPITKAELDAMVNGNKESFQRKFSLNAFNASVNKWRAHELSSHFELETLQDASDILQSIETGKGKDGAAYTVDVNKIAEQWVAKTKGFGDVLAGYSADAAYKYRATAAVQGNKVFQAATKAASEQNFLKNQVKIEKDISLYSSTVRNAISNYKGDNPVELLALITAERDRIVGNAMVLGGVPAQKLAIEKTSNIEADVMKAMFQNYVFDEGKGEVGDVVALQKRIRENSLPPYLKNMWSIMSPQQQKAVRDGIASEFDYQIKLKEDQNKIAKQELKVVANEQILVFLEKSSTLDQQTIALDALERISKDHPDIVSAQFLKIDLPKMLDEKAEDDPVGLATLLDGLRENKYSTAEDVLSAARSNGVTAKTAFQLSKEYLSKDSLEVSRKMGLAEVEHLIRTKQIKYRDLAGLKNELAKRGLTLADGRDLVSLLDEEPKEDSAEDNMVAFATLSDQIENGEINSAAQLLTVAKTQGYIKPSSLRSLMTKIVERRRFLDSQVSNVAKQVVDDSGSKNPVTQAKIEMDASKNVSDKFQSLLEEHRKNGFFVDSSGNKIYKRPTIKDAGVFTRKSGIDETVKRRVEATRQSLSSNWGPNGSLLSKVSQEKRSTSKLNAIVPIFKNDMSPDPIYLEALSRELKRLGIDPKSREGELAIDDIVSQQRSIEKALRNSGGR